MRTDRNSGNPRSRIAPWSSAFPACLWLAAALSGCVEINRPKAMIYSTSSYYWGQGLDDANDDRDMSLEFTTGQVGSVYADVPVRYGEPMDFSLAADSSKPILELRIKTRPNLQAMEDFFEHADVKVEVARYEPPIDSLSDSLPNPRWRDSVVVRFFRMGAAGDWVQRDTSVLGWDGERRVEKWRRVLKLSIPLSLLDASPVLGWVLVRYQWKHKVRMPYQPTLFIRDEKEFKNLAYP